MKWDNNFGCDNSTEFPCVQFKVSEFSPKMNVLNLFSIGSLHPKTFENWKLQSLPVGCRFVKMTLKSHPGKALVMDNKIGKGPCNFD